MEYSHFGFKTYYEATIIKTHRTEIQINGTELNRNKPHVYKQLILTVVPRKFIGEGIVCPKNGAETTESERTESSSEELFFFVFVSAEDFHCFLVKKEIGNMIPSASPHKR